MDLSTLRFLATQLVLAPLMRGERVLYVSTYPSDGVLETLQNKTAGTPGNMATLTCSFSSWKDDVTTACWEAAQAGQPISFVLVNLNNGQKDPQHSTIRPFRDENRNVIGKETPILVV